jgi:hypothetical protein
MERRGFIARAMAALGFAGVSSIPGTRADASTGELTSVAFVPLREKASRYVSGTVSCDEQCLFSVYLTLAQPGLFERWTLDNGKIFQVQRYRRNRTKEIDAAEAHRRDDIRASVWGFDPDNQYLGEDKVIPHITLRDDSVSLVDPLFTIYPHEAVVDVTSGVFKKIRARCGRPYSPGPTESIPAELLADVVNELWASIPIDRK